MFLCAFTFTCLSWLFYFLCYPSLLSSLIVIHFISPFHCRELFFFFSFLLFSTALSSFPPCIFLSLSVFFLICTFLLSLLFSLSSVHLLFSYLLLSGLLLSFSLPFLQCSFQIFFLSPFSPLLLSSFRPSLALFLSSSFLSVILA